MATKKPTATDWLNKIRRAIDVRKKWREHFRIETCYEYWEGNQRPKGVPDSEWVTINMIYSNLKAELPSLYNTDPYFYVKLKKSYSVNPMDIALFDARAKARQSMLNYLKGELELKTKARLCIFDAHFQYGAIKVYFAADMIDNPDAGQFVLDETSGMPLIDEKNQPIMEPEQIPVNEAYKITRIHPDDFLVDEDAGPLNDGIKWRAQQIKQTVEEIRGNKAYRMAGRKKVKAVEYSDEAQKQRELKKKGGLASAGDEVDADIAILWEVYDWQKQQWLVVAEGCDVFLLNPEELPKGVEDDPFVDLRFTLRDDSWYPMPPVSQWIDAQRDYCETRSKVKTHRKRFNRKYEVYAPGLQNEGDATKLEVGDDGTIILKSQPTPVVTPIQDAPLDQQVHMEISYIRQDFMDLALGPNQRGATAGVDSATEAGILEKRTQIREGDNIGLVMDFISKIARKLDQIIQANITQDQAVKVTGPAGDTWQLIKATDYADIPGEFEFSINVGAETPRLPEIERAQLLAALGVFSTAPQLLLSRNLTKKILEMHHIYDEAILDDLQQIAQAMMGGQIPMPGQQGSQPNVTNQNPQASTGGMAAGINNFRGGQQ